MDEQEIKRAAKFFTSFYSVILHKAHGEDATTSLLAQNLMRYMAREDTAEFFDAAVTLGDATRALCRYSQEDLQDMKDGGFPITGSLLEKDAEYLRSVSDKLESIANSIEDCPRYNESQLGIVARTLVEADLRDECATAQDVLIAYAAIYPCEQELQLQKRTDVLREIHSRHEQGCYHDKKT